MDTMYTGNQIAQRRKALGLTQKALAEQLHVTDKAVSKWERGLNFPDLGILEALAAALETTPAVLLGLEHSTQAETITSMTQLSQTEQESVHREICISGWIFTGSAIALIAASVLWGGSITKIQTAYRILYALICLLAGYGIWLLFRHGEIRKWELADWGLFYGFCGFVLVLLGVQFFTGSNPPAVLTGLLICGAACCIQLLFCRIMRPRPLKALPLILTGIFALWHLATDGPALLFLSPALSCLTVWGIWRRRNPAKSRLSRKKRLMLLIICFLLVLLFFYNPLVRFSVTLLHQPLEHYSQELLAKGNGNTSSWVFGKSPFIPSWERWSFLPAVPGLLPAVPIRDFITQTKTSTPPSRDPVFLLPWMANWPAGRTVQATGEFPSSLWIIGFGMKPTFKH